MSPKGRPKRASSLRMVLTAVGVCLLFPGSIMIYEQIILNQHLRIEVRELIRFRQFTREHAQELLAARSTIPDDTWQLMGTIPASATGEPGSRVYLMKYRGAGTRFVDAPEDCLGYAERIRNALKGTDPYWLRNKWDPCRCNGRKHWIWEYGWENAFPDGIPREATEAPTS